ncbi:MAG: hypothetical protein OXG92_10650 [Chloroflexi bacterium]|nr:hypothetical protein [Chloroflexota bacterium]MCY3583006.1 hypothetical protein [Chloroflexota bacterium]MCY3716910.1 hypothetical protein [Chloroflexota bacterium]MDE2650124.1 hypothetical protein [Chloroflexota bacterium]MXV92913.1 hypothetical protein [Chloroflexota bacterium]
MKARGRPGIIAGMNPQDYYLRQVLPRLENPPLPRYPAISLLPRADSRPLGDCELSMLVGLTGCGKSTTLAQLGFGGTPSRREVADCIAIPYAQALAGEALLPLHDRARRFEATRRFAQAVPGGMAAAFSWLWLRRETQMPLLTEGIRGDAELRYALERFPHWRVVELALPPLHRLRRLSVRRDAFDQVDAAADFDFLPLALQDEARALLINGEINQRALAILRAEARNYGLNAFAAGGDYPNYQRLDVVDMRPETVTDAVRELLALPCPR